MTDRNLDIHCWGCSKYLYSLRHNCTSEQLQNVQKFCDKECEKLYNKKEEERKKSICNGCDGKGEILHHKTVNGMYTVWATICSLCDGTGLPNFKRTEEKEKILSKINEKEKSLKPLQKKLSKIKEEISDLQIQLYGEKLKKKYF